MFVQLCLEVLEVMRTESTNIFYSIYCHDLNEILWVTNFLLYLSNMLTTVVVKELRFY